MSTRNGNGSEECVLKCKDGQYFFAFPNEDIFRNLWLYKLDLDNYEHSFRVCDRHFSEAMFNSHNVLVELAVPNINLPNTFVKKKEVYDQLIDKIKLKPLTNKKVDKKLPSIKKKDVPNTTETSNKFQATTARKLPAKKRKSTKAVPTFESSTKLNNSQPFGMVKNWLHDSSNILMDYQLRVQGRHVCDVIEVPEYVVVFTIVKPKTSSAHPNDLIQSNKSDNSNQLTSGVSVATENTEIVNEDESQMTAQRNLAPYVDYVYYSTEETIPRREREVQVDMANYTKESSIQCNIELDNDIVQMTLNPRVYHLQSPEMQIEMHECQICGEILSNYAAQMRHALGHQKCHSLCPLCGEVFPNRHKLRSHESNVHWQNGLDMKSILRCPKLNCKKAFHSQKQLNNHIDDHIRNLPCEYRCRRCMRSFASSLKLHCHQKAFKNCLKYSKLLKVQMWGRFRK